MRRSVVQIGSWETFLSCHSAYSGPSSEEAICFRQQYPHIRYVRTTCRQVSFVPSTKQWRQLSISVSVERVSPVVPDGPNALGDNRVKLA